MGVLAVDPCRALRNLLVQPETVLMPSAYDCISARVLAGAGYKLIHISGAGVSASLTGYPDLGLITLPEMAQAARHIARCVDIPVIADADTGHGNALNVVRTVAEFEQAGVAGLHLEDQVFPKRCGHLAGKQVIPAAEYYAKIRAAAEARRNPDFVIIARTDAIAVHGIDDAIERANRALECGADVAFVEAPTGMDQVRRIAGEVRGPNLYNMALGGVSPALSLAELQALGFKLGLAPAVCMFPALYHMRQSARAVLEAGSEQPVRYTGLSPHELFTVMGLQHWLGLSDRYTAAP